MLQLSTSGQSEVTHRSVIHFLHPLYLRDFVNMSYLMFDACNSIKVSQ